MSKIKQSLEDNKEAILKELPEEFHKNLEDEIAAASDPVLPTEAEEAEAIKKELVANPDVDDAAVIKEFESNPTAHKPAPPPSDDEVKKEMEELLAEAKANVD